MAMNSRAEQLALQRLTLQLRCALQRQEIAHLTNEIESRLVGADRFAGIAIGVGKTPLILVSLFAGTMLIGPWRILKWLSHGTLYFSIARTLLGLFKKK